MFILKNLNNKTHHTKTNERTSETRHIWKLGCNTKSCTHLIRLSSLLLLYSKTTALGLCRSLSALFTVFLSLCLFFRAMSMFFCITNWNSFGLKSFLACFDVTPKFSQTFRFCYYEHVRNASTHTHTHTSHHSSFNLHNAFIHCLLSYVPVGHLSKLQQAKKCIEHEIRTERRTWRRRVG